MKRFLATALGSFVTVLIFSGATHAARWKCQPRSSVCVYVTGKECADLSAKLRKTESSWTFKTLNKQVMSGKKKVDDFQVTWRAFELRGLLKWYGCKVPK
jgi:hypothetical protein